MNVLVIAGDFVKDQLVLQPIIEAMLKALGSPRAKVKVCKDPRFHGTSEALKWDFVQQALSRHQGMVDLFLLCVDRDGNASRKHVLESLEDQARNVIGHGRAFLGVNAWQEIEVWLLAGHDLPAEWDWREIRSEVHPKERDYLPFAEERAVLDLPGEGRDKLAKEAAKRYSGIRKNAKRTCAFWKAAFGAG